MGGGVETQNNSKWYTIRVIKPIRMFDVHVNEEFSLLDKTGLTVGKGWKHPYILYCYKELIANSYKFDSELVLNKLNDDRYRLTSKFGYIENDSIITVLVMESDEEVSVINTIDSSISNSNWNTLEKLSINYNRIKLVKLNDNNNFTFDLDELHIGNNFNFMVFINKMRYAPNCYAIKCELLKLDNNKFKLLLKQKYCDIPNTSSFTNYVSGNQNINLTNVGSVSFEIKKNSEGNDISFRLDDGNKSYNSQRIAYISLGSSGKSFHIIRNTFINSKNKNKTINLVSLDGGSYSYRYNYYTSSDSWLDINDFDCQVLLYQNKVI